MDAAPGDAAQGHSTPPWKRRSLRQTSAVRARLAVSVAGAGLPELVVGEETIRSHAAGVGAVAAPGGQLLEGEREGAPGGIVPGKPVLALEGLEVGEPAVLETLQPHAAAARQFGHLIEREDHHLAVLADRGGKLAFDYRQRACRV